MDLITLFLQYNEELSLFFRAISLIEIILFILPLQIKEAGVRNGLARLRIQLLIFGATMFIVNTFSMIIIFSGMSKELPDLDMQHSILQVLNAIGYFILSTIGVLIYNQQYKDENKRLHEEAEKILKRKEGKV